MWANMLPKVRPSLQLLCHLITNYTPLLHDNDVGRRRCNQWPNKTIHHHSHRGNKRGDHRGARISEGHHGRQGHRGNRGDRRRKRRQWHRSNRKYPADRGRHREHRASGPRRGHLAGGSSSRPGHTAAAAAAAPGDTTAEAAALAGATPTAADAGATAPAAAPRPRQPPEGPRR
ncbi:unnamed protein product [Arctogadus glacialis]